MLKPLSAASAPLRSQATPPVSSSDSPASPDFGDALEAARQAARQAAPRSPAGNPSRPAPGGTPAAPSNPALSTATPQVNTEPANGLSAARQAGLPTRSRDREDPAAAPPAKTAADNRPDASATAKPAATPAVTPDSLAAAITPPVTPDSLATIAATPGTADRPQEAVGTDAGSSSSAAAGLTTGSAFSAPSSAARPDATAAPDDATAKPGPTATSPSNLAATAQSLLSETILSGMPNLLPGAQPSAASATGKDSVPAKDRVPAGAQPLSAAAAAASSTLAALSGASNLAAGARPAASSATPAAGKNAASTGIGQLASGATAPSVSTLVDTIQRTTGIAVDRIAITTGSSQAAPDPSIDAAGTSPGDQAPGDQAPGDLAPVDQSLAAAIGPIDPNAPIGALDARSLLAADPANASLLGTQVDPTTHPAEHAVAPMQAQEGGGTTAVGGQAADPQAFALQAGDLQMTQAGVAGVAKPLPNAGAPPSVASQIAPAVVSMAQSGAPGGRLSVSITPEQLGQVHITVERAADGTTSIHVAAEQLGTLNILRHDQAGLTRALDQAGVGQSGHNLSFSWEGGGSGTQGWNTPNQQSSQYQPANVSKSYAVDFDRDSAHRGRGRTRRHRRDRMNTDKQRPRPAQSIATRSHP